VPARVPGSDAPANGEAGGRLRLDRLALRARRRRL
jgi:hypothetical protein